MHQGLVREICVSQELDAQTINLFPPCNKPYELLDANHRVKAIETYWYVSIISLLYLFVFNKEYTVMPKTQHILVKCCEQLYMMK
jgi:hypothetical protein